MDQGVARDERNMIRAKKRRGKQRRELRRDGKNI